MKYLKKYKIFESESIDGLDLEKNFGITYDEVGDVIQDMLDFYPGLTYETRVHLLSDRGSIFNNDGKINKNGVDYFIILINSDVIFDDRQFAEMLPEVDSKLSIYGLEIMISTDLSNRSLGENIFVSRISDEYNDCKKIPKIEIE